MPIEENKAYHEFVQWKRQMLRKPSMLNNLARRVQTRINNFIPEKVHQAITTAIKQMSRLVIFGAGITTGKKELPGSFGEIEVAVLQRINFYKKTAAAEGGITGAGGILAGLVDFPLLLGIKIKLLFEIAALYGVNTQDYRERVYLLHIFQLAFSSQEKRKAVFLSMENWAEQRKKLPDDIHQFDWRGFQQEYRDYIDIAKMAQLIPVIGAPVGAVVNYRLIKKLGTYAMNAYRMRWFEQHALLPGEQRQLH